MARYSSKQYAQALFESLEAQPAKQDELLKRFASMLVKNNDSSLAYKIIRQFQRLQREKAGAHTVVVTTAKKPDKAIIDKIQAAFKHKAQIKENIDESVLGGIKLLINDEEVINSTLKSRIDKVFTQAD